MVFAPQCTGKSEMASNRNLAVDLSEPPVHSLPFQTARSYLAGLVKLRLDLRRSSNWGCFAPLAKHSAKPSEPSFKKPEAGAGDGSSTPSIEETASTESDSTLSVDSASSSVLKVCVAADELSSSSSSGSGSSLGPRSYPRRSGVAAEGPLGVHPLASLGHLLEGRTTSKVASRCTSRVHPQKSSSQIAEEGLVVLPLQIPIMKIKQREHQQLQQERQSKSAAPTALQTQDREVPAPVALGLLAAACFAREGQHIYRWKDGRRVLELASRSQ